MFYSNNFGFMIVLIDWKLITLLTFAGKIWRRSPKKVNQMISTMTCHPIFKLLHTLIVLITYPAGNNLFKVDIRKTKTSCEICSKFTLKTPEQRHWRLSGVFILLFRTYLTPCSSVSVINFEHVNTGWVLLIRV